jgi:hypothetical protein
MGGPISKAEGFVVELHSPNHPRGPEPEARDGSPMLR